MSLKLKNIKQLMESMTIEQKKKLLIGLCSIKEKYNGNVGGAADIVSEDEFTSSTQLEPNIIAKTFNTKGDLDTYVNQRRGIEITQKERQAIIGFKQIKPTQQDKFFIKYETSDEFGNNDTTIIKKLKDENQFCWTAFSTHENAKDEGKPEGKDNDGSFNAHKPTDNKSDDNGKNKIPDLGNLKEIENQLPPQNTEENEGEEEIIVKKKKPKKKVVYIEDDEEEEKKPVNIVINNND